MWTVVYGVLTLQVAAKCVAQAHSEGSWAQALCFGLAGERGQEVAESASRWWLLGSALSWPACLLTQCLSSSSILPILQVRPGPGTHLIGLCQTWPLNSSVAL